MGKCHSSPEMSNRRRFLIDYVIDYLFFWHIRNRIRHFFQKSNRNRIRIRQKKYERGIVKSNRPSKNLGNQKKIYILAADINKSITCVYKILDYFHVCPF